MKSPIKSLQNKLANSVVSSLADTAVAVTNDYRIDLNGEAFVFPALIERNGERLIVDVYDVLNDPRYDGVSGKLHNLGFRSSFLNVNLPDDLVRSNVLDCIEENLPE